MSASTLVLPPGNWTCLLEFLQAHFAGISAEAWRLRLQRGDVLDEDGGVLASDHPYRAGSVIHYYRELESETSIPFEADVIYRDEHLLIADKPHFLPVVPAGRFLQQTLLVRLKRALNLDDLVPLHRIDRGTAGLVAFSLNPRTRAQYQALFPKRGISKGYEALAPAVPASLFPLIRRSRMVEGEPFFRMREIEGTPNTETRIEVLETRGALSLYGLQPVTGKKHQLRVHLAALGAPIVNDAFYPELQPDIEDDFSRPLKLLARSLAFTDPVSGEARHFVSRRQL